MRFTGFGSVRGYEFPTHRWKRRKTPLPLRRTAVLHADAVVVRGGRGIKRARGEWERDTATGCSAAALGLAVELLCSANQSIEPEPASPSFIRVQPPSRPVHRRRRSSCRNLGVCPVIEEGRDEGEGAVNATEVVAVAAAKVSVVQVAIDGEDATEEPLLLGCCSATKEPEEKRGKEAPLRLVTSTEAFMVAAAIRAAIEAIDLVPIPPFFRPVATLFSLFIARTITGIPLMPSGNC
ncbi:uncharacterized protein LOC130957328 [Arachis stenosperma]|uniref:uncharacterized protein LOC130957328 n=1 Tax=Arachis stenosperma TaxID=217475 RepID=UPI0025AB7783|nr:uncharacterized protein LOC130957328 [Arachis stenosperma]